LIKTILDAWRLSPDGEVRHGPIWSFASDGDGVRRAAFHNVFMTDTLGPHDSLYGLLGSLEAEANSWKLLELGKSFNDVFPYVVNHGALWLVDT
jgi:hypothetical protein